MKIGYSVEGSTDRAFLTGLKQRWCPFVELIEGRFRGSTRTSLRREYAKIGRALHEKAADVMVFLTDADGEPWREVQREQQKRFPDEYANVAVLGVADRNVECWLCLDWEWLGSQTGSPPESFRTDDPKGPFESAVGVSRNDRKEDVIAGMVESAPLSRWVEQSVSFKDFYDQLRAQSLRLHCQIENLRWPGAGLPPDSRGRRSSNSPWGGRSNPKSRRAP